MKKKTLLTITVAAAIIGGVYAFAEYIYKLSSVPHQHNGANDFDPAITRGREFIRNHKDREDVFIESFDELRLHASYIPAGKDIHKYAIIIHGIWDDHESNGIYAKHYLERGINCLLPDLRGFGKSEGKYIGYGLDDSMDIMGWIDYLITLDPEAEIILHGMSMGAATTLMTTGAKLPSNVKAAVSDSSFSTLRAEFATAYRILSKALIPIPLALAISRGIILLKSGFDINDVNCLKAVARSKTPTLFIHGDDDTFINPQMCSRLYEAASCPKQYCMILGARHIEGVVKDPVNYWNKVDGFLAKYAF
ncbi:MAG: alpha/beta hydrolase [Butyrivibrio sp.]|nr:alpha/beta hydrolase [Butyrivibrio sp.]